MVIKDSGVSQHRFVEGRFVKMYWWTLGARACWRGESLYHLDMATMTIRWAPTTPGNNEACYKENIVEAAVFL